MGEVNLKLRSRNVGHAWYDKQVIRWFRSSFEKIHYKNLRNIYIALTEIDSDFNNTPINGLSKTIQKYAGVSPRITTPYIHFLQKIGLIEVKQLRKGIRFGASTLQLMQWTNQSEYYKTDEKHFDNILKGNVNIRKSQLVTNVVNDKCRHYKNTKVSTNKNTKVSNLSKDKHSSASTAKAKMKRIIKIKKKPVPIKKQLTQKKYTILDNQIYNELVQSGATNHRKESDAYTFTMNCIHALLSTKANNPFSYINSYTADQRNKQYTPDELIDCFKWYLKNCKERDKKPIKSIGSFIVMKGWGNSEHYSPFLGSVGIMKQYDHNESTGDVKVLMRECDKININLSQMQANRIMNLLESKTKAYSVPTSLNHLYFGKSFYIFLEYLDERIRRKKIQTGIISSEIFIDGFIKDALFKKTLIKGNVNNAY